jgi:hypothetical protein
MADILERPVAVVQVKHVGPIVAQEHVLIAVVVDVANDDPVAESPIAQSGNVGHVTELAVAQVPVQPVWPFDGGAQRQQGGRGKVDVHQAVVVGVEDSHARTVGRGEVLVFGHSREVNEVDAGFPGDLGKAERARFRLLGERHGSRDHGHAVALDC